MADNLTRIKELLADLEEDQLMALVRERVAANDDPMAIVDACRDGMQIVGERFAAKEYFVNDLVMSAELFNNIMEILGPKLEGKASGGSKAKVVMGTAQGDIHDIGKNIVTAMLRCNGFEVFDIGVDQAPAVFVDKVRETGATVVGISGLLTLAFSAMGDTVKALDAAGLRKNVKVIIGGGPVTEAVCTQVGADAFGRDAMEAVRLVQGYAEAKAI